MTFTSIEVIALILLIVGVVKIFVLLINPKKGIDFSKELFKNKRVFKIVVFVLAAVVFYYLIKVFTIVQIFAVIAFVALLIMLGLAEMYESLLKIYKKHIKEKTFWKSSWLYILIWLVLMIWVFIELFL